MLNKRRGTIRDFMETRHDMKVCNVELLISANIELNNINIDAQNTNLVKVKLKLKYLGCYELYLKKSKLKRGKLRERSFK